MEEERIQTDRMIRKFQKNILAVSDGIMALTKGQKEDINKKSLKAEEEVFSKELSIWAVMKLVELLQGLSLGKCVDIDGLH